MLTSVTRGRKGVRIEEGDEGGEERGGEGRRGRRRGGDLLLRIMISTCTWSIVCKNKHYLIRLIYRQPVMYSILGVLVPISENGSNMH